VTIILNGSMKIRTHSLTEWTLVIEPLDDGEVGIGVAEHKRFRVAQGRSNNPKIGKSAYAIRQSI
jgi:hypothetical protein